ncbi:MAG: GTPase [Planctomycetota bacterium]
MIRKVLIMGAAGRDFHDFLTFYRDREDLRVVAFTAEQIPGIEGRVFPAELAGERYPEGIPIHAEEELPDLVKHLQVDEICLAYSDLSHQCVMEKASLVLSCGVNFTLLGSDQVYVRAEKPVIAVTAVRTGCGKSQTARAIAEILRGHGKKPVAIRHSMPYGRDLRLQACQRFAEPADFVKHQTTIEEEEEYQPWLDHGFVVYAGFDYRQIVNCAEEEGDILIFDGGNNDLPMIKPDLQVTVLDPHRAGHELGYYPGLVNLLMADIVVINKVDSADPAMVEKVEQTVIAQNPSAEIVRARSELVVDRPDLIEGQNCIVVGDGPTLSHGGMKFGAGSLAVQQHGGRIVDPRAYLVGSIAKTYERYPHLELEIPAMGYSKEQIAELQETINAADCDVVVDGSPARLDRVIRFNKPVVYVGYELGEESMKALESRLLAREFC